MNDLAARRARSALSARAGALLLSLLLGAASVLGFAPFYYWPVPIAALAGLAWLIQHAATPRRAALLGLAFGLGYFVTGVSWVFVSMHRYGGMSVPLASFATLFFCTYLALFPAAAAWIARRARSDGGRLALVFPAAWALAEWVRGWMFTGFPWLAVGYAQSPAGPLSGFAPIVGAYGVSLLSALSAGLLVWWSPWRPLRRPGAGIWVAFLHPAAAILAGVWLTALALKPVAWTAPEGAPVSVSLVQGNIEQEMKWRPERAQASLDTYLQLTLSSDSRLILLPETALPLLSVDVPVAYLDMLKTHAQRQGGDILLGVPEYVPAGAERESGGAPGAPDGEARYYNSVMSYGASPTQVYRKHHLVPFGDYFPRWFFVTWVMSALDIPMSSFSRGDARQQPLAVAGQRVAANICYEDVFGEEIIGQLPAATVLANFTNDAWWGDSAASEQHLQMSQMRAQEAGRYMLRATNTGVTAIIDQRGRVLESAPEFAVAVVRGSVQGFSGSTPYVWWGNWPFLAIAAAMLFPLLRLR
ncbi:MAG TPA: apolipoprotein N-acyltransferase [Burkholderiales bacterium]|jgi:apolipoprotein N-acyltransferase